VLSGMMLAFWYLGVTVCVWLKTGLEGLSIRLLSHF